MKKTIGDPIPYEDFNKNKKNNPKGDNVITKDNIISKAVKKESSKLKIDQFYDDEETKEVEQISKGNSKSSANLGIKPAKKEESKPNNK